jgi:hypothetical protein
LLAATAKTVAIPAWMKILIAKGDAILVAAAEVQMRGRKAEAEVAVTARRCLAEMTSATGLGKEMHPVNLVDAIVRETGSAIGIAAGVTVESGGAGTREAMCVQAAVVMTVFAAAAAAALLSFHHLRLKMAVSVLLQSERAQESSPVRCCHVLSFVSLHCFLHKDSRQTSLPRSKLR